MYTVTLLEFLNMGGSEIMLILAVVLLLFGGKKLPELARGLGKGIRDFKDASEGVKREIHRNINSLDIDEELNRESRPTATSTPTPSPEPATEPVENVDSVENPSSVERTAPVLNTEPLPHSVPVQPTASVSHTEEEVKQNNNI
jgi:sec-independent protein translocase protein TatA